MLPGVLGKSLGASQNSKSQTGSFMPSAGCWVEDWVTQQQCRLTEAH